jgi:6-phosphogluconolactonase (cycloisomerase 2 family)
MIMKTPILIWLTLAMSLLLTGCPDGGAGGGNGEGSVAPAIVYTANETSNNISAFTVGTGGALTFVPSSGLNPNPAPVGTSPRAVSVSSNGQFLYVANSVSNNVTAFTIGAGGVLTLVPPTGPNPNPVSVGTTPNGITVSPNGQFLYVANSGSNNVTAFTIGAGGVLTLVPATGPNPNPVPVGTTPNGIAVSPNGQFLYVANSGTSDVTAFTIGAGGVLTPVSSTLGNPNPVSVGGTTPNGITVSPSGQFLYVANSASNDVTAFSIGGGGVLTFVPSTLTNPNPVSVVGATPRGIATPGRP